MAFKLLYFNQFPVPNSTESFKTEYLLTSTFENSKLVTLTYFLNSFVYKKVGQKCPIFLDFMDSPSQTYMKWPLKNFTTVVLKLLVKV